MLTGSRRTTFRQQLLAWFREFRRDLPWRKTKDPYRIWVSEIMLQQTRVAVVIPYYERFLQRFPDARTLAEAPEEEVLRLWSGLGYYSRARNLQKAARQVVGRHGGEFPRDAEAIHALSGIGEYTGAAILSIAFGAKRAVLDGNVARVLARLGAVRGDLRESKRWRRLQSTADALLEPRSPGAWNQAMMELGAIVCTPRSPHCLVCPVAKFCRGRRLGSPEAFPQKREKRDAVEIVLAVAVFCSPSGQALLLPPPPRSWKRPTADDVATLVSGMWHFPTVAAGTEPEADLRKHLAELLPLTERALVLEPLRSVKHAVTYRNVTALPFLVAVKDMPPVPRAKIGTLDELSTVPISNLTRKIARVALADIASARKPAPEAGDPVLWRAE